jgi:hypothetical protein
MAVGANANTSNSVIEQWNGRRWAVVSNPNPGTNDNQLWAVSCRLTNACIAVGQYGNIGSGDQTLIESWDGTSWSVVPSPGTYQLRGVSCISPTACTAVGASLPGGTNQTLIESWNGTTWSIVPSPNVGTSDNGLLSVSCGSVSSCTAVGNWHSTPSSNYQTLIESWNGTSWSVATSPSAPGNNYLYGVSCVSGSSCTAVGESVNAPAVDQTLIEAWNGTTWSIVPSPNVGPNANDLRGVSCTSVGSCIAAGSSGQALIESGDGTSWSVTPSPFPRRSPTSAFEGVSCLSPTSCAAVGEFQLPTSGLSLQPLIDQMGL